MVAADPSQAEVPGIRVAEAEERGTAAATECPACGEPHARRLFRGTDRLYGTTKRQFHVIECTRCRLIRLDPQPSPADLAHFYPRHYWFNAANEDRVSPLAELYRRLVIRDHVSFVDRAVRSATVPAGQKAMVLDVGCGGGLLLHYLQRRGHRVTGLDYSIDAAAIAWRTNGVPAFCGMLTQPPLADESFDAVTMFHVLEHLYDPAGYLRTAHRLLRPDGRLVIQVPNASCWQFILLGEHWNGLDIPRHFWHFRPRDIEVLLDEAGFVVTRRKDFSLRDNPAGLATSIAPGLDPMARLIRGAKESNAGRFLKNLMYFGLVVASVPFALLEAACGAGSTMMFEARKKPSA